MERAKKNRSLNWSEQEKKILRMLIFQRAEILERKDTSTKTNLLKAKAWGEVLARFNALGPNKRDVSQLQNQWRNMKNRAKKAALHSRNGKARIGGGPFPRSPKSRSPSPRDLEELKNWDDEDPAIPLVIMTDPLESQPGQSCMKQEQSPSLPASPLQCQPDPSQLEQEIRVTMPRLTNGKWDTPGPSLNGIYQYNKNDSRCCLQNHDHELFELTKQAQEQAMRNEKEAHELKMKNESEIHEMKMTIMSLEEKYWRDRMNDF